MPAEGHRPGGEEPRRATEGTRVASPVRMGCGGELVLCLLTGWLTVVSGWADSPQPPEPTSLFRLWHDLQDVFIALSLSDVVGFYFSCSAPR